MQEVFEFDYILEMYKPAAKRRWGYYALPILYGDRLVGKLDAKTDRDEGVLPRVAAIHQDVPFTKAMTAAVDREIADLARWLQVDVERAVGRRAAEADVVAVRVAEGRLPYAAVVRLLLVRLESAGRDVLDVRVEVLDEEHDHAVPGVLGLLDDVQVAVLGQLPDRFGGVRGEAGAVPSSASYQGRARA